MGKIASVGDKLCQTAAFKVWFVDFHRHRHHNPWHAALCSIDKDSTNPMITPASKRTFFLCAPSPIWESMKVSCSDRIVAPPPQPPHHLGCCAHLTCADRTKARQVLHLKPRQAPSHLIRAARLSSRPPPVSAIASHLMRRTHQTLRTLTLQG